MNNSIHEIHMKFDYVSDKNIRPLIEVKFTQKIKRTGMAHTMPNCGTYRMGYVSRVHNGKPRKLVAQWIPLTVNITIKKSPRRNAYIMQKLVPGHSTIWLVTPYLSYHGIPSDSQATAGMPHMKLSLWTLPWTVERITTRLDWTSYTCVRFVFSRIQYTIILSKPKVKTCWFLKADMTLSR